MPVLVLPRMIVAGVAAVYLGRRWCCCTVMSHFIVAETVQLKQYLVCQPIRRACSSGCAICRHLFLVDAVDLRDSCRIRIVGERKVGRIGIHCSRYGFLHQCEVISAVDTLPTAVNQLARIRLDLRPVNLHSRIRGCVRDSTKSTRLCEGEHRIIIFEIVADGKDIRIEVTNLLCRYTRRRNLQCVRASLRLRRRCRHR